MSNTIIWIFTAGIIVSLIASVRQLREEISRMKRTLNNIAMQVALPDPINEELKGTLLNLVLEGEKVKAVKEYRKATGSDILEAKRYIDHLTE